MTTTTTTTTTTVQYARKVKQKLKRHAQVWMGWEDKPMHRQYPKRAKEEDQAIKTKYYRSKILNDGTRDLRSISGNY